MSRIAGVFDALRQSDRKALIPYVVAGDPDPKGTVALLHELVASGADVIEVGVPFSDPMAEGPVIQKGHERALQRLAWQTDILGRVRVAFGPLSSTIAEN